MFKKNKGLTLYNLYRCYFQCVDACIYCVPMGDSFYCTGWCLFFFSSFSFLASVEDYLQKLLFIFCFLLFSIFLSTYIYIFSPLPFLTSISVSIAYVSFSKPLLKKFHTQLPNGTLRKQPRQSTCKNKSAELLFTTWTLSFSAIGKWNTGKKENIPLYLTCTLSHLKKLCQVQTLQKVGVVPNADFILG